MNRFKVGDRVRRVRHSGDITNCPIGHEAEVLELLSSRGGFWYEGADGSRQNTSSPEDWEPVVEGPVRTVTRKEIVSGIYGRVEVGGQVQIPDCSEPWIKPTPAIDISVTGALTSAELTTAIATLTTIRDALDEVA